MKRILSAIIILALLLSIAPLGVMAATDATVYTEASATELYSNDSFTYSVYLSGTYDGYSLEIIKSQAGLIITQVTAESGVYADDNGSFWRLSVLGGLGKKSSPKTKIATIAVTVDANAVPGTKELGFSNVSISSEAGDRATHTTILDSVSVMSKITGTVALSGVTAPVRNATPVTKSGITAPANATINSITWSPADNVFAPATTYTATINIEANDGYLFAADVAFTVDGVSWTAAKQNDGSYNLTKTFPKTADKDMPVCTAPAGVTATYGQTLADITLSNPAGNTPGTWSWMTPATSVGNASDTPVNFKAKFVPDDGGNYETVENIDVPVTVNAKIITASVAFILDQEYTGSQIMPAVVVTGDGKTLTLNTDYTVEYGTNITVGENVGSVTVKAKENGNYTFANVTKNFNIVAKAGNVSISGDLNVPYGTNVPDVTINTNGSDGATTTYYYTNSACTEGKTTAKPTNAGNYWVQVEMEAGTNHGAAVSNILDFTISRLNITPLVSIEGWTYKETANAPSVTGNTESGAVTYYYKTKGADNSAYTTVKPENAGEYTVKAEIAQTTNYNAASATTDFTIAPRALTNALVADVAAQGYTGTEIKPMPTVTDGITLTLDTDYTYTYEKNTYVGNAATVHVVGKGNYSGTIDRNFSITAVEQTPAITATASVTRGGNTLDLKTLVANAKGDLSFAISGEANGCTIDNGVLTSGDNSATVKITVSIEAKDVNGDTVNEYNEYSLTDAITITVNDKATQTALNITSAATVTYGQTLALTTEGGSGTGAVTYAVTNGSGEATVDGNILTPSKVGTVTVIATKAEDAAYNSISSTPVVITIEKVKVAIPAEDTTVYTYTGKEQTYKLSENAAYTISGNKQTNANETGYSVTVTLNETETHAWSDDTIDVKHYTFVIKKATITVVAKDQVVYVKGTVPVLDADDYTVTGLVNGETFETAPSIEYETTPDTSAAGSVVIKVYGAEAPDGGNYNEVVYKNGTLTIKKRVYYGGGGSSASTSSTSMQKKQIVLTINETKATVFGEETENDVAPVIVNSSTMLPARFVAEKLGATVEWDETLRLVTIKGENVEIKIYIGSDIAYVNGAERKLDAPAFIQNGRTYTPLRFIGEELGAIVDWNDTAKQVIITKK